MTEKEAINILSEKIPKGSDDFERLYKLYGDVKGSKSYAIYYFDNNWAHLDIEALEVVTKMYLKDLKPDSYKLSFSSFLETDLELYIQVKQKELEDGIKETSFF